MRARYALIAFYWPERVKKYDKELESSKFKNQNGGNVIENRGKPTETWHARTAQTKSKVSFKFGFLVDVLRTSIMFSWSPRQRLGAAVQGLGTGYGPVLTKKKNECNSTFWIGLGGKKSLGPIGDHVRSSCFFYSKDIGKTQYFTQRVTNTDESKRGRQHASSRARRRQPLLFFSRRRLESCRSQRLLRGRNSDGGAAIQVLSISSVLWVYPSVLVQLGRSCCWKNCDCDRRNLFWGATAGVRGAMVFRFWRGECTGRRSLRFTISLISRGRRQSSNSRRIASGALAPCEHTTSSWINSDSILSNFKASLLGLFLWIGLNRISLASQWKCLLVYCFFYQSDPIPIQSS